MKINKNIINVGIVGVAGRMGMAVARSVISNKKTSIKSGIEHKKHKAINLSIGDLLGQKKINTKIISDKKEFFKDLDVVIEFGLPKATKEFLLEAKIKKVAYVSGSTGLNNSTLNLMKKVGQHIPVFWAPNMSIGANLLKEVACQVAMRTGKEFDINLIDLHHKLKRDTPSGTAINIKNDIEKVQSKIKPRKKVNIIAMRAGDSTGEHTIIFSGKGESLELKHTSSSREIFSEGAVKVAEWLVGKPKGFYQMHDYLNLKRK